MLKHIRNKAAGRIEILPAGGIRASNVNAVIEQSGCNQIHTSVREVAVDPSTQHNLRLSFGLPGHANGSYGKASADQLQKLLSIVHRVRDSAAGGLSP